MVLKKLDLIQQKWTTQERNSPS